VPKDAVDTRCLQGFKKKKFFKREKKMEIINGLNSKKKPKKNQNSAFGIQKNKQAKHIHFYAPA